MIKWLYISLWLVSASIIVEYRFGVNLGQVFIDYSGNGWYGVNGNSLQVEDDTDVICTDRGIYFANADSKVKMPSNAQVTAALTLPSDWLAVMWVNLEISYGIIFRRTNSGSGPYFFVYQDSDSRVSVRVKVGSTDTTTRSANYIFIESKL